MALLLSRRTGECIHLRLNQEVNADDLLTELALQGIEIYIKDIKGRSVVTAITAPLGVTILRGELIGDRFGGRPALRRRLVRWLCSWRRRPAFSGAVEKVSKLLGRIAT